MITVEPCTRTYAAHITNRSNTPGQDRRALLDQAVCARWGIALLADGEPVAMILAEDYEPAPEMGHVWAIMTEQAKGHALGLVRAARKAIKDNMGRQGYKIIYTFCLEERGDHCKWVQTLGFKRAPQGDHDEDGKHWKGYTYE